MSLPKNEPSPSMAPNAPVGRSTSGAGRPNSGLVNVVSSGVCCRRAEADQEEQQSIQAFHRKWFSQPVIGCQLSAAKSAVLEKTFSAMSVTATPRGSLQSIKQLLQPMDMTTSQLFTLSNVARWSDSATPCKKRLIVKLTNPRIIISIPAGTRPNHRHAGASQRHHPL